MTRPFGRIVSAVLTMACIGMIAHAAPIKPVKPAPVKPTPAAPASPAFSSDPSQPTDLSCDKSPGASLCYSLEDAIHDYLDTCSGDNECGAVWMGESGSDANVINQFEMNVLPSSKVSQDIGKLSFYLAEAICMQKRTGVNSYGYQAFVAEIKIMPYLQALQRDAGVTNPQSCKISMPKESDNN